ncbi:6-bladed beta-propeller [Salinibacter sp. 10B]|uniref:6-bladed beta-propeller n=1 Tax=Salinibacter sp. 10B TaxID=1923971 RepID=UPI0015E41AE1|nr:6-bladed beta-propeller [Salinibacter sp. 10B]
MTYRLTTIILPFLLLVGCSGQDEFENRNFTNAKYLEGVSNEISNDVLNPFDIVVEDNIYVVDNGDQKVKSFSKSGVYKGSIGRGKGSGPGEVVQVGEFDIHKDTLWIADMMGRKVVSYNKEGDYIDEFKTDHPVNKLKVFEKSIVARDVGVKSMLVEYDKKGKVIKKYGKNLYNNPMDEVGHIFIGGSKKDDLLYLMQYTNIVLGMQNNRMSKLDTLMNNVSSSEKEDSGPGEEKENMKRFSQPDPKTEHYDSNVYNERFFILTKKEVHDSAKNDGVSLLDVYDNNFNYITTYKLHDKTKKAFVANGCIYSITESNVRVYDI